MTEPCPHPKESAVRQGVDNICRRCGAVTTWPQSLAELILRLPGLRPMSLPPAPWALHTSRSRPIGEGRFIGGDCVKILNTDAWLKGLRAEVSKGVDSPRYRMGVLQDDLHALNRVLMEQRPEECCF